MRDTFFSNAVEAGQMVADLLHREQSPVKHLPAVREKDDMRLILFDALDKVLLGVHLSLSIIVSIIDAR